MNENIKAIRTLANGEQPDIDIYDILYSHNCSYLISKISPKDKYTNKLKIENVLNKACIIERYKQCAELFNKFEECNIPYAVIKGAVLSVAAYNNPFIRHSGDIDLLVNRKNIDQIKKIMLELGFIQGRVTENGIEPFSRKELLFQTSMSHQIAPFVKNTNKKLCPYVNVDINLDILWGESEQNADMDFVLEKTQDTTINHITFKKLCPEMEFISLCLHHYKDMNSIYLLYERGLRLSHFCDIYFYIKNSKICLKKLNDFCHKLNVKEYVYYCLYYTNLIFSDSKLDEYQKLLYSKKAEELIDKFGLDDQERQTWNVDFFTRLFEANMSQHIENTLDKNLLNKIKINQAFM